MPFYQSAFEDQNNGFLRTVSLCARGAVASFRREQSLLETLFRSEDQGSLWFTYLPELNRLNMPRYFSIAEFCTPTLGSEPV